MIFKCSEMSSPVGNLAIAVANERLVALCFDGIWERRVRSLERQFPGASFHSVRDPGGVRARLGAYFGGDLDALDPIAVEMFGTPFQQAVWAELRRIPVGQTRTYGEIARSIGQPAAVRAVGTANGANP